MNQITTFVKRKLKSKFMEFENDFYFYFIYQIYHMIKIKNKNYLFLT
jgi:hypothetical protein